MAWSNNVIETGPAWSHQRQIPCTTLNSTAWVAYRVTGQFVAGQFVADNSSQNII